MGLRAVRLYRKEKNREFDAGGTGMTVEPVEIVEVASLSNQNSLHQFLRAYPYFPELFRPNTVINIRFANALKPLLIKSLFLLKPSAWADLLIKHCDRVEARPRPGRRHAVTRVKIVANTERDS